jgi:hypothetical protein
MARWTPAFADVTILLRAIRWNSSLVLAASPAESCLRTELAPFADHDIAGIFECHYGKEAVVTASPRRPAEGEDSGNPAKSCRFSVPPGLDLQLWGRQRSPMIRIRPGFLSCFEPARRRPRSQC